MSGRRRRSAGPASSSPPLGRIDVAVALLAAVGVVLSAVLGIVHIARGSWDGRLVSAAVISVATGSVLGLTLAARLAARRTASRRRTIAAGCAVVTMAGGTIALVPLLVDVIHWRHEALAAVIAAALLGPAGALFTGLLLAAGEPPAGWPRRIAVAAEVLAWLAAAGIATILAIEFLQQTHGMPLPRGLYQGLPAIVGLALAGWAVAVVTVSTLAGAARRRRLDSSEAMDGARIALDCPDCAAVMEGPPGLIRCPECRGRLLIEIEEPRCPCGYVLYRLAEPRCPECGRAVEDAGRYAGA